MKNRSRMFCWEIVVGLLMACEMGVMPSAVFANTTNITLTTVTNSPFYVGETNAFNSLMVTSGVSLTVTGSDHSYVGYNVGSSNNMVLVSGTGSAWNNGSNLFVGGSGAGNLLTVSSGGVVTNERGYVGYGASASNNLVAVTGTGSKWLSGDALYVGGSGSSNTLALSDGGMVSNASAAVGYGTDSSNNLVTVTGTGSTWRAGSSLIIGHGGSGNRLVISGGGSVSNTDGYVGYNVSASNSVAEVNGLGSSWNHAGTLSIGDASSGNALTISSGGVVTNTDAIVGNGTSASNNVVTVTGAGSKWINRGNLRIGADGYGSRLLISNGASVNVSNILYIGYSASSVSNTVALTSGGSLVIGGDLELRQGTLILGADATVNVAGSYVQETNGTLRFLLSDDGVGQLVLHDAVTLTNGVVVSAVGGHLGSYVLITNTASSVFSNFDNQIVISNPWLTSSLTYDPYFVTLNLAQNTGFVHYAVSHNQKAVAARLDANVANMTFFPLFETLDILPTNQLASAYDQIAPEELTALPQLSLMRADAQEVSLRNRLRDVREGRNDTALQTSGGNLHASVILSEPHSEQPWSAFLEGAGAIATVDDDVEGKGYDFETFNLTIGLDRRLTRHIAAGIALASSTQRADLTGGGRADVDSFHASVYGTWYRAGYYLNASAGGGTGSYDTQRQTPSGMADGHTDGTEWQLSLEGGRDWQRGALTYGPQIGFRYADVTVNGFTETGSASPMSIEGQNADSLQAHAGGHVGYSMPVGEVELKLHGSVAAQYECLNEQRILNARFVGDGGNWFAVEGPSIGRFGAALELGAAVQFTPQWSMYADYGTQLGRSGYAVHTFNLGYHYRF